MPDTCDVCQREGPTSVRSSSLGAMSNAYCEECRTKPAEPEWMFHYTWEEVAGKDTAAVAQWVHGLWTWADGAYIRWTDWTAQHA